MKYNYNMIDEADKGVIFEDAINCMISALEYKDVYTKGHSRRVGEMAAISAMILKLEPIQRFHIEIAGHLHDIGKIGIPDSVLLKKGKLNDYEWREMKRHPIISADIISEAGHLGEIAEIVYQHHEKWDGSGYPNGLSGDEIQIGGRILALCDALDAMASNRAYRKSLSWDEIEKELYSNLGKQFDPELEIVIPELIEYWAKNFEGDIENVAQSKLQLDNLIDQHARLRILIDSINKMLESCSTKDEIDLLISKIVELAGVLRIHLNNEDRYLYPRLMTSKNNEVMNVATEFDSKMGDLSNNFISFKTRYNSYENINKNPQAFISEFKNVISKLIKRLDKEDKELYPLIESDKFD